MGKPTLFITEAAITQVDNRITVGTNKGQEFFGSIATTEYHKGHAVIAGNVRAPINKDVKQKVTETKFSQQGRKGHEDEERDW